MRHAVGIVAVVFAMTAVSLAGVTVSAPANGSTVGSPVHFVASASASRPITAMRIYVDNNSVFLTSSSRLDTYVSMSTGKHYVVVQAWDSSGAWYKAPFYMTVGSSTSPGVTPAGARTYGNIDQMSGWQHCDSCAGINGAGPTASYSMKQYIANPSMDGQSAQFFLGGTHAFANALWWKQLGANAGVSNFVYDLYFYITNPTVSQALEFDVNQSVNGRKYIFGTECVIAGGGHWDVWDTANAHWVNTGIPCPAPPAYRWNHLVLEFKRSGGQTVFVAVTMNGVKRYINRAFWSKGVSAQELNVAFQMDGNYRMDDYSTWLDKVKLVAW